MDSTHRCLVQRIDPRDWKLGDGNIALKATGNPDWTSNYHFRELQKINNFETDCCVIFGYQESVDGQIDRMIENGEIPQSVIDWFTANNYMDAKNSDDGKPHFHSSERFIAYNTGNGFNGNAQQDPGQAGQAYGIVPWLDWPFDATITPQSYFDSPPIQVYAKGKQFLQMMGQGVQKVISYHWVNQGQDTSRTLLDSARTTAPISLGVATTDGWNQDVPTAPPMGTAPNHVVDNVTSIAQNEIIEDHYVPFKKTFTISYPLPDAMQYVVQYFPPPPPLPTPPSSPVNPGSPTSMSAWSQWLSNVASWLRKILDPGTTVADIHEIEML